MCLGIPGKVVETYREHDVRMGKVAFGGIFKRVCLEHVPEARVDDYVLVHVGFALSRIEADLAWFHETGYVAPPKSRAIRALVNRLCGELRTIAGTLVEGYGIPDECLAAPIATGNGPDANFGTVREGNGGTG